MAAGETWAKGATGRATDPAAASSIRHMGRPSSYSQVAADLILNELSEGSSLREICEAHPELPSAASIRRWIATNQNGFCDNYARVKQEMAEKFAEEILEIADDGRNDWMTIQRGGEEVEVENKEVLNRSRLRVETRKWLLSKLIPKKYGDRTALEHSGADGGPLTVSWLPSPPKD